MVVGDLSEKSFGNYLVNHLKNDGDNGLLSNNNIQFCQVDVTQPETITAALDVIQDIFGIPVNAVGTRQALPLRPRRLIKRAKLRPRPWTSLFE